MAQRARRTSGGRLPSRARAREEALAAALSVRVPESCDVCVAGGGAAGIAAGIAAAEEGASVCVLERSVACGRTILATGNGRCNFMNAGLCGDDPEWGRYNDPAFVEAACGSGFGDEVLAFFEDCGLAWAREEGGRLYPLSRQASSVREVLLARAARASVTLAPAREVAAMARAGDGGWVTSFDAGDGVRGRLRSRAAVLAAGGGEQLARDLGLACAPWRPVLCSLRCDAPEGVSLDALDGRRAHVVARLLRDGDEVAVERGEVLFRPYGISGIVTFDLSRRALPGDVVSLDLTGGLGAERARRLARAAGGCAGVLDPRIAGALGPGALDRALDLRLVVRGPAEPERAQVSRGGLACAQFDPVTLGARELPGLFACGEALDVDGACGGFNLAWAWASGLRAGSAAARRAASGGTPGAQGALGATRAVGA